MTFSSVSRKPMAMHPGCHFMYVPIQGCMLTVVVHAPPHAHCLVVLLGSLCPPQLCGGLLCSFLSIISTDHLKRTTEKSLLCKLLSSFCEQNLTDSPTCNPAVSHLAFPNLKKQFPKLVFYSCCWEIKQPSDTDTTGMKNATAPFKDNRDQSRAHFKKYR